MDLLMVTAFNALAELGHRTVVVAYGWMASSGALALVAIECIGHAATVAMLMSASALAFSVAIAGFARLGLKVR